MCVFNFVQELHENTFNLVIPDHLSMWPGVYKVSTGYRQHSGADMGTTLAVTKNGAAEAVFFLSFACTILFCNCFPVSQSVVDEC